MTTHLPTLGFGELTATIRRLPSLATRPSALLAQRIFWSRAENDASAASVSMPGYYDLDQSVRRLLPDFDAWSHELVIERSGSTMWEGPCTGFVEQDGLVTINAQDFLVHAHFTPAGLIDLTGDACLITADALNTVFDGTGVNVDVLPAGVPAAIRSTDPTKGFLLDAMSTVTQAGVSIRAIGTTIRVRHLTAGHVVARLTEDHFTSSGTGWITALDGQEAPDQVAVYGAGSLVALYPPTVTLTPRGRVLVVRGYDESTRLTSQAEVDGHARDLWSRLRANGGVAFTVPAQATLSPDAPIRFEDLEPGNLVRVELRDQLIGWVEPLTMRIVAANGQQGRSNGTPRNPNGTFARAATDGQEQITVTLDAGEPWTFAPPWTFTPDEREPAPAAPGEGSPPPRVDAPSAPGTGSGSGGRGPAPSAPGI